MIDLTKENFEEEVLKAQGYVLVDFYGDGCVPCAALMPHIHKFEEVYGTSIKFCSLNTTKARRLAIAQKVLGLPVIAIYKDGEMIDSRVKDDATPRLFSESDPESAEYYGPLGVILFLLLQSDHPGRYLFHNSQALNPDNTLLPCLREQSLRSVDTLGQSEYALFLLRRPYPDSLRC